MQSTLPSQNSSSPLWRWIAFWAGPVICFFFVFLLHPSSMPEPAVWVAGFTIWISTWWVTECVPLPVTSLLPIVMFPLAKILDITNTTASYGHPLIFLYLGGFLLAIAIEKSGLHIRIALSIISRMGIRLNMIVLGFMIATAFISMWISNTATVVMMLPIGLAIIAISGEESTTTIHFRKALMLGIAYAASIGGVSTLVGTPPNLVFAGVMKDMFQQDISFLSWMVIALPLSVVVLLLAWLYLTRVAFPVVGSKLEEGSGSIQAKRKNLGVITGMERRVAIVFCLVAIAWITRTFLLQRFIPKLDDTLIAIVGGIILFMVPAGEGSKKRILHWEDAVKVPWGIILLFGGGLAIAEAFEISGLAAWIGSSLSGLSGMGSFLIIVLVAVVVNILTEFTSNVATVTMILPVLLPVASAAGLPGYILMAGATMAASYGFMMPAGTPPNAIVFGTGYIRIQEMIRTGAVLNLISVLLISGLMYFLFSFGWKLW